MRPQTALLALALVLPVLARAAAPEPAKTADEVIRRNVAARGGLEAWRRVDTLVWLGHLERADAHDLLTVISLNLQNGEQQVLLAKSGRAFDFHRFRHLDQFRRLLLLQVF